MSESEQREVCRQYGAQFLGAAGDLIAGLSDNLGSGVEPVHGLRHPLTQGTSGWYLWAGEWSDAADFYKPHHLFHLKDICPRTIRFLGLPPGWRFLLAADHVDVWFDESLLAE